MTKTLKISHRAEAAVGLIELICNQEGTEILGLRSCEPASVDRRLRERVSFVVSGGTLSSANQVAHSLYWGGKP